MNLAIAQFEDRPDAGRFLATKLKKYRDEPDVIVLALPRGGVPVAHEIAKAIGAPLDVFIVRKLGVPGYEELAMGAIASGGVRVLNDRVVRGLGLSSQTIDAAAAQEQMELQRRERQYRGIRPALQLAGKTVILVDDGLATGATMRAAVQALRQARAKKIIVAAICPWQRQQPAQPAQSVCGASSARGRNGHVVI